jgi:hypothetical protein
MSAGPSPAGEHACLPCLVWRTSAKGPSPRFMDSGASTRDPAAEIRPERNESAEENPSNHAPVSDEHKVGLLYLTASIGTTMRSVLIVVLALLFFSELGACAEYPADAPAPVHPDLIMVRRFVTPRRIIVLDPSLGFSLHRGQPGVPPARRAASVARATAFILADTITEQLRKLGYDAVQSDEAGPEPGGRALIVSGAFRSINEGHRRNFVAKDASVAALVEIESQTHGEKPQRLMIFQLNSRQIPHQSWTRREPGVNSAAMRLGVMIAHEVAELMHRKNWPRAPL